LLAAPEIVVVDLLDSALSALRFALLAAVRAVLHGSAHSDLPIM
jgi:hypothetical protein